MYDPITGTYYGTSGGPNIPTTTEETSTTTVTTNKTLVSDKLQTDQTPTSAASYYNSSTLASGMVMLDPQTVQRMLSKLIKK